jgi:hypothetical protein
MRCTMTSAYRRIGDWLISYLYLLMILAALTVKCVYNGVFRAQCEYLAISSIPVQKYFALRVSTALHADTGVDVRIHRLFLQHLQTH